MTNRPMASSTPYAAAVGAILSFLVVAADAASPAPAKAPTAAASGKAFSVEEACKQTAHSDLCVATLSRDPSAKSATDTAALARVAIQAAQRNASETATYLSSIATDDIIGDKTPELQQCLDDCGERYEAAVEQLTDATVALDGKEYDESVALVASSQAEVKMCQKKCQAVPGHKNVLTVRNREVDRLCSVALAITKLIGGPPS
ncbi:hypothetical protein ACP70R_031507 [Stipagrostis hirtigluma subsp. patula]